MCRAGYNESAHMETENRDYPPPSHQYGGQSQSYGHAPPPEEYRQHSYGSPPPVEGYRQQSYGGNPTPPQSGDYPSSYQQQQQQQQQQHYSSPPPPSQDPVYEHPSGKPPLPSGWIPQWDRQYQRWYYAEEATGRTQWEAPGAHGSDSRGWGSSGDHANVSHGGPGYSGYGHESGHNTGHYETHGSGHGQYPSEGHGEYYEDGHVKEKKKKDNTLLYAAGGLAAGAIGGALIAQALGTSHLRQRIPNFEVRTLSVLIYQQTTLLMTSIVMLLPHRPPAQRLSPCITLTESTWMRATANLSKKPGRSMRLQRKLRLIPTQAVARRRNLRKPVRSMRKSTKKSTSKEGCYSSAIATVLRIVLSNAR